MGKQRIFERSRHQTLTRIQHLIDYFWEKLSVVREAEQCGWLIDRFGVSWQIVPLILNKYLKEPDSEKAGRVMEVFLKIKKIAIAELEAAYEGKK